MSIRFATSSSLLLLLNSCKKRSGLRPGPVRLSLFFFSRSRNFFSRVYTDRYPFTNFFSFPDLYLLAILAKALIVAFPLCATSVVGCLLSFSSRRLCVAHASLRCWCESSGCFLVFDFFFFFSLVYMYTLVLSFFLPEIYYQLFSICAGLGEIFFGWSGIWRIVACIVEWGSLGLGSELHEYTGYVAILLASGLRLVSLCEKGEEREEKNSMGRNLHTLEFYTVAMHSFDSSRLLLACSRTCLKIAFRAEV